jgi:hypothetical protein
MIASPPLPGTNSAGTANSSGVTGITTGSARQGPGPQTSTDAATDATIANENKTVDRKLNSICRGC